MPRTPRIQRLIAQLAVRDPVDEREAAAIAEVLDGLHSLDRPLDQDADPTHVTGSALIISSRGIVLLKHKRLGIWLQPGGHVDPGEDPAEAAHREAMEETGLAVRHWSSAVEPPLAHVDAHDGGRGHRHLDLRYVLSAPPQDPQPPPGESQQCRWFTWEEALLLADDGLRGILPTLQNVAESADFSRD